MTAADVTAQVQKAYVAINAYEADFEQQYDMKAFGQKKTSKGLIDLWEPYCPAGSNGDCTHKLAMEGWKDKMQKLGLLPTDAEYAVAKAEMVAAGCWIWDD